MLFNCLINELFLQEEAHISAEQSWNTRKWRRPISYILHKQAIWFMFIYFWNLSILSIFCKDIKSSGIRFKLQTVWQEACFGFGQMHFVWLIIRRSSPWDWYVSKGKAVYCSHQYEMSLLAYCNPPKAPRTCLNIINAKHQLSWLFS